MSEARQKFIPAELSGQRLDRALARMFPEYSRSRLKSWLLQGFITVNERAMRPRDPVIGGESVLLQLQPEISVKSEPEALDLDIIFEDEDCLVVNKPVGLVVHPGAGNPRGTLMNGLLHHDPGLDQLPRAGIIHRLDKDTSGLLLVAKTLQAHTALTRALAERKIARHYLAVCAGVLTGGGSIKEPIGRHPVDRLKMSGQRDGKPAVTHYRVIQRFAAHTYVSVQLETGRTHQIRVHFAHRRQALVGDQTYGGRLAIPAGVSDRLRDTLRQFRHQALHAEKLAFAHPRSGENIDLQLAPPADFADLLSALAEDSALRI
ncbi:MAG: 23S rRNA pseudouridine(1911/1915/1917) synthase RluD [Proteobacteria bacterium]|nr:23S rRNA pseudouridine(1911/1915/1917) synthase RluD [Pseudomonadota bacterium]